MKMSEALLLLAWGGACSWPVGRARWYKDRLEGVDIDAEYELIKQKTSKLPRALRDRIVAIKEAI